MSGSMRHLHGCRNVAQFRHLISFQANYSKHMMWNYSMLTVEQQPIHGTVAPAQDTWPRRNSVKTEQTEQNGNKSALAVNVFHVRTFDFTAPAVSDTVKWDSCPKNCFPNQATKREYEIPYFVDFKCYQTLKSENYSNNISVMLKEPYKN